VSAFGEGAGKTESITLCAIHLNRVVTLAEALAELRDRGLRPARYLEVVSLFGAAPEAFDDPGTIIAPHEVDGRVLGVAGGSRGETIFYPSDSRFGAELSFAGVHD
jgi:hypothetical protein